MEPVKVTQSQSFNVPLKQELQEEKFENTSVESERDGNCSDHEIDEIITNTSAVDKDRSEVSVDGRMNDSNTSAIDVISNMFRQHAELMFHQSVEFESVLSDPCHYHDWPLGSSLGNPVDNEAEPVSAGRHKRKTKLKNRTPKISGKKFVDSHNNFDNSNDEINEILEFNRKIKRLKREERRKLETIQKKIFS